MTNRTIDAAQFKAHCLALLDEVQASGETLTITKQGKAVVVVSALPATGRSLFGSLAGAVYSFDDPFSPATDPADWEANR